MNDAERKYFIYLTLTPIRTVKNWLINFPRGMAKPIKPNTLLMAAIAFFAVMVVRGGRIMVVVSVLLLFLAWAWREWVRGDFRVKPPL